MPDKPPYHFDGFNSPNYTQIPDKFFDSLMQHLSEAELRVCLYIMRRTFGFKKNADAISINQMVNGITTRDGKVLDYGCGLGRTAVKRGVQGLVDKGVLHVTKQRSENGEYETNIYRLVVRQGVGHAETHPTAGVGHETTHPGSPGDQPVGREETLQETVEQQTEQQERTFENSKARQIYLAKYDEDRLDLLPYVEGYAREFRDQASLASSVTRTIGLYRQSRLDLDTFIHRMEQARAITKERTGSIRAGEGGRKQMMSYWFAVLQDLLGDHLERRSG
jgi:hypothetical protein